MTTNYGISIRALAPREAPQWLTPSSLRYHEDQLRQCVH